MIPPRAWTFRGFALRLTPSPEYPSLQLLAGLFRAAPALLSPLGELHATLVHRYPYTAWRPAKEAERVAKGRLAYCGVVGFDAALYAGYAHVTSTMDDRDSRYAPHRRFCPWSMSVSVGGHPLTEHPGITRLSR